MEPREAAELLLAVLQGEADIGVVTRIQRGLVDITSKLRLDEAAVVSGRWADVLVRALEHVEANQDCVHIAKGLLAASERMPPEEAMKVFTSAASLIGNNPGKAIASRESRSKSSAPSSPCTSHGPRQELQSAD